MKRTFSLIIQLLCLAGLVVLCAGAHVGLLLIAAALLAWTSYPRQAALFTFPSNCEGRIINVSASNGCTLTRADIRGMTPQDFEDQGFKEIGMDKVYANLREARVAGYRENSWQALLMSRISNIKGQLAKSNIGGSESVILPYIQRRQRRNINVNWWKITAGAPTPGAGTGDTPASAQDLTVTNNPSAFASTLQNIEQYFLPGTTLFVEYTGSNNVAYSNAYKILSAKTTAGVTKVTCKPNYTDTGWLALSAAAKAVYQIGGLGGGNAEAGTIGFLGANSVSDFQSWGGQDNAENTNSLLAFWPQTSRIVHEYTDEYLRALNASLTSNYFKLFRQLPLAQQKARQQQLYDAKMLNSAWFGQRRSEKQTVEGYRNLETVVDPANPSCALEYIADAIGFEQQLIDCNRQLDHQGNPLNLDSLFNAGYLVKRARQADGSIGMDEEPVIDIITDPVTAGMIRDMMIGFYTRKYGTQVTRFYNPDQKLEFDKQVMFKYSTYQIPDELGGYVLAVFGSEVLRDRLSAAGGANRQRFIFMLDWTDIELGMAGTNSAVRRTNEADQLYNYVIRINAKHITLNSQTWCPIIEDPNRHYLVKNFSAACPTLTVTGCNIPAPQ